MCKKLFFYWMSLLEGVQISLMYTKKLWNNDILSNWVNSYVFYIEISPFRPSGNICLTLLSTREKCVCMFVYISIIWKCYLHSHFISLSLFLFVITEQKKNWFFPSFVYFSLFASTSKSTQKRIKMKKSSTCNCINKFHLQQVVARIWDFFYLLLEAHIAMYINFSDDEWASEWVSEWRVRKEKEKNKFNRSQFVLIEFVTIRLLFSPELNFRLSFCTVGLKEGKLLAVTVENLLIIIL